MITSTPEGNRRPGLDLEDGFRNVDHEWPRARTALVNAVKSTIAESIARRLMFSLYYDLQEHIHSFEEHKDSHIVHGTARRDTEPSLDFDDKMLVDWQKLHDTIFRHEEAYENAAHWCGSSLRQATDIDFLLGKASRLEKRIREQVQIRASAVSIEESRRAINQSQSVGRLTQLAFVFLPLTFTTGVFGMNITPSGGEAPMWKFWVTSVTIGIGALLIWAVAGRLERAWIARQKRRAAKPKDHTLRWMLYGMLGIW